MPLALEPYVPGVPVNVKCLLIYFALSINSTFHYKLRILDFGNKLPFITNNIPALPKLSMHPFVSIYLSSITHKYYRGAVVLLQKSITFASVIAKKSSILNLSAYGDEMIEGASPLFAGYCIARKGKGNIS